MQQSDQQSHQDSHTIFRYAYPQPDAPWRGQFPVLFLQWIKVDAPRNTKMLQILESTV